MLQQVLGRFEEEGGGHLLVATLCLLEVSATGLLEAELLQLLADEENLMPNSIEEKGSPFIKSNRELLNYIRRTNTFLLKRMSYSIALRCTKTRMNII